MNILFVFPNASLSNRVRTNKICHFFSSRGWSISHWGWLRKVGEDVETFPFNVDKKILMKSGGYSTSKNKVSYVIWMAKVFFRSWLIKKTSIVWAVGFESAFPLLLASKMIGYKVVFDDADRFSMVFPFPSGVKRVIQYFERITSRNVCVHLVPNLARYDFESEKLYELKNMPSLGDVQSALQRKIDNIPAHDGVTLYVNGLLDGPRGIDTVLRMALGLRDRKEKCIRFLVAGPIRGDFAERLVALDDVLYLGRVSNDMALALYRCCDFVLTYYDPTLEINRYAESNKWGDALKMGVPVIVNTEVTTAAGLREAGVALSFEYSDDISLRDYLLRVGRQEIEDLKHRTRAVGQSYPYFEEGLAKILSMLNLQ